MFTNMIGGVDPDVAAHFERMSSTDGALRAALSRLILGLKSDNLWPKIEILNVVHIGQSDSLLNLKGASIGADSTVVGSPTFTANRGFTTLGSTNYITMGFAETDAAILGLYDSHFFAYANNNGGAGGDTVMLTDEANQTVNSVNLLTGSTVFGIQSLYSLSVAANGGDFSCGSCTAINRRDAQVGISTASSTASTSHTLSSIDFSVGFDVGDATATNQFACWGIGSGLTAAELLKYRNRIQGYANDRGF